MALDPQKLANVEQDIDFISAIAVNTGTATNRLGETKKTLPQIINEQTIQEQTATAQAQIATTQAGIATQGAADNVADQQAQFTKLFTRAGYVNSAGVYVADANWLATPPLELTRYNFLRMKLNGATNVSSIAFYDAVGTYISSVISATSPGYVTAYPASPPANAATAVFTMRANDLANQRFTYSLKDDPTVFNSAFFTITGYVGSGSGNTAGAIVTDVNWKTTPRLPIAYLNVSQIKLQGGPAVSSVSYFDANGVFIPTSGTIAVNGGNLYVTGYSPPAGAAFVQLTARANDFANQRFVASVRSEVLPPPDGSLRGDITPLINIVGYLNPTTGALVSDTNFLATDFIPIKAGGKVSVNVLGQSNIGVVGFYDSNKALSGPTYKPTAAGTTPYNITLSAPVDGYFRISCRVPSGGNASFVNTAYAVVPSSALLSLLTPTGSVTSTFSLPTLKRPMPINMTGKTGITVGDSRGSDTYPFIAAGLTAQFGGTWSSVGIPGATVAALAAPAALARMTASNPDVLICMLGGNDGGAAGTVGTLSGAIPGESTVPQTDITQAYNGTYFIQAVDHIIRWWKSQTYNIRARANLTGTETETEKNDKIRAVKKPMLIMCTDLPQRRADSSDARNSAANLNRKRQAIIEACYRNNIHCVDTAQGIVWDMTLEPGFSVVATPYTNEGVYTLDGVHPNEFGAYQWTGMAGRDAGLKAA